MSFHVWLVSLSILSSRFIHAVACVRMSFLLAPIYYSIRCLHHNFFIHSSLDGHSGCFQLLAIVNNAAMNVGVQISFWVPLFNSFEYKPEVKLLDGVVIMCWISLGPVALFSTGVTFPPAKHQSSNFPTSLPTLAFLCSTPSFFKNDSRPSEHEVASHCGFDLHFMLSIFSCAYWPSVYLWRNGHSSPLPIFYRFFCLFGLLVLGGLYIFWILIL